jgi:AcrR family transcriptional regulator
MPDNRGSTTAGPANRRPPGEGRDLLLKAAAELFAERGYQGASTREISERAGIAETLLFRNFGSKAALFNEVITSALSGLQEQWLDGSEDGGPDAGDIEAFRAFVDGYYTLLCNMRGIVLSTVGAAMFEPETLSGMDDLLKAGLEQVTDTIAAQLGRIGLTPSVVADETVLAMICAMALFQDWLVPASKNPPSHDEIVGELTELILHGIRGRA